MEICQIPHAIFERASEFSFKFCINLQCHQSKLLCPFFCSNIIYFGERSQLNSKCFRFSSARVKIRQIPHVNFEMTSQFLFKFCIILHCYDTWFLCRFLVHTFSSLDKRIPSKSQFWYFQVLWWKFAKFLMSFVKQQVTFSSNFASLFNVMKDNSSVLWLKHYILWSQKSH